MFKWSMGCHLPMKEIQWWALLPFIQQVAFFCGGQSAVIVSEQRRHRQLYIL